MQTLQVGDKAPAFSGQNQNNQLVDSKQFKGKKYVVYFYPKDDTPGCTAQACSIRDGWASLQQANITVIGISPDDVNKHKKFETKYQLPFSLIADINHEIAESFGVWGPKKFMGKEYIGIHRTTFIVNEKGIIEHVIAKPDTKNHAQEILALLQ